MRQMNAGLLCSHCLSSLVSCCSPVSKAQCSPISCCKPQQAFLVKPLQAQLLVVLKDYFLTFFSFLETHTVSTVVMDTCIHTWHSIDYSAVCETQL